MGEQEYELGPEWQNIPGDVVETDGKDSGAEKNDIDTRGYLEKD